MTATHLHPLFRWILVSVTVVACAAPSSLEACDAATGIELGGERCLVFQDRGALSVHRDQIERVVRQVLPRVDGLLQVDGVDIAVLVDARRAIPGLGLGGYAPAGDRIELVFDSDFADLSASIDEWLSGVIAHELHHAARHRTVGYGRTLLEAAVSEGLADHFSLQVIGGEPPPWSVALDAQEIAAWTATARATWSDPGYSHSRWFFGDHEVPRWTGYALGYAWVADYLAGHASRTAAGLVDQPAGRLAPPG